MSVTSRTRSRRWARGRSQTISIVLAVWLRQASLRPCNGGTSPGTHNCPRLGTIAANVVAGPLNYIGVNPRIASAAPPAVQVAGTKRGAQGLARRAGERHRGRYRCQNGRVHRVDGLAHGLRVFMSPSATCSPSSPWTARPGRSRGPSAPRSAPRAGRPEQPRADCRSRRPGEHGRAASAPTPRWRGRLGRPLLTKMPRTFPLSARSNPVGQPGVQPSARALPERARRRPATCPAFPTTPAPRPAAGPGWGQRP